MLAACGGGEAPDGDGGADGSPTLDGAPGDGAGDGGNALGCTLGADPSASGACADMACVTCGLSQQCSLAAFAATWTDRAACQARTAARCELELADPAVKMGAAAVEACAAASTSSTCASFLTGLKPAACGSVPGAVAEGGACTDSAQCATGLCSSTTYPCGTCSTPTPGAPIGGTCILNGDCAPGLNCTTSGTCAAYVQEGGLCEQTSDCVPTLVCWSGTCVTPLPAGAPCMTDAQGNDACSQQEGLECSGPAGMLTCTSITAMLCGGGDCTQEPDACCGPTGFCFSPDIGGGCEDDAPDQASCAPKNVPSGEGTACLPPAVCSPAPGYLCTLYIPAATAAAECTKDGG